MGRHLDGPAAGSALTGPTVGRVGSWRGILRRWRITFARHLGLEMWHSEGRASGRATIRPEMWATGTRRPRLGLLFTLADIVGGTPPSGALTPTVDLRLQLLTAAPSLGEILMEARPLKVGRRLWTGEVLFTTPGASAVFARSEFTFLNQSLAELSGGMPGLPSWESGQDLDGVTVDDVLQMRHLPGGVIEMDPHEAVRNGAVGTIQGGAQATMAEVAAERALASRGGGSYLVADLHLRYLSALKVGPAVAEPLVLPGDEQRPVVQVRITDRGAGGQLVTSALAVCRPERRPDP